MIANGAAELPETVPAAVRNFLSEHVESYEQLELLLLMRSPPHKDWSFRELTARTQLPPDAVDEALAGLARAGCITRGRSSEGSARYAPRDGVQAAVIEDLAQQYQDNRLAIIKLMSANAIERVRTAAIHTFADAFVIGRKKDG